MQFSASAEQKQRAQTPHNLFISGSFFSHLLLAPAAIVLDIGMAGLLLPLLCTLLLTGGIYLRSRRRGDWFVDSHWRLSWARCRVLLYGYAFSGALIVLAWLLSLNASDVHMGHIFWTALTRVALVPTLIIVMVTAVLEFSAYAQAGKGEVPDTLAARYPPPAGLPRP
ncbi:MAG: hypothetical protein Fur0040_03610 [Sideroxydans sp.]